MEKNMAECIKCVLGLSDAELAENSMILPEIDAVYCWSSGRAGKAMIINAAGERLIATSAVRFEDHVKAFKAGRRN